MLPFITWVDEVLLSERASACARTVLCIRRNWSTSGHLKEGNMKEVNPKITRNADATLTRQICYEEMAARLSSGLAEVNINSPEQMCTMNVGAN